MAPITEEEEAFEREASAAGIVLPKRAPTDVWGAVAIAVAVIAVAAGVGQVTGWINLSTHPSSGGFQLQTCSTVDVRLVGSVGSGLDPSYATWLASSGNSLSQSVGGCVLVNASEAGTNVVASVLGGPTSRFVATYLGPGAPAGVPTGSSYTFVPVALSSVAIVYDLPGVSASLQLTGVVIAGIFDGTITQWNDSAIVDLNPGIDLGGLPPISVRYDLGQTASNAVLSEFLAGSSPAWNSSVGAGAGIVWPTGSGVADDAAMLAAVAGTPGAIGYVDLLGNAPSGVGIAEIEDAAGVFVGPNAISTWLAAQSFANSSDVATGAWGNFSLLGASESGAYPVAMLAYLGMYSDLGTPYQGSLSLYNATWVLEYTYWLACGATLSPLPANFITSDVNRLSNVTYDGTLIVPPDHEDEEGGSDADLDVF